MVPCIIPGSGTPTISLAADPPTITGPVLSDGSTQAGVNVDGQGFADVARKTTPTLAVRSPLHVHVHPRGVGPEPTPVTIDTLTIEFSPSLAGQTLDLTTIGDSTDRGNSALAITAPILIDCRTAPGLTIARSSAAGTRAFRILYVAGEGNLTLSDLTIFGGQTSFGDDGGGLLNFGTVALTGDTFTGNSAFEGGGFFNFESTAPASAMMTLSYDTFTGNTAVYGGGGGDNDGGTAGLNSDTFTDNFATVGFGGGLLNYGVATLSGPTTITGNTQIQGVNVFGAPQFNNFCWHQ